MREQIILIATHWDNTGTMQRSWWHIVKLMIFHVGYYWD